MKYGFLLPVIIAACLVFAQNTQGQMIFDTLLLKEFEVFATKNDYSQAIKKTTIDTLIKSDLSNLDLGELLAAYTPVFIKSYGRGALATASFRGTGASHTQVLWNDFQINSPMLGQVDFSQIPNAFFDEVELFYGGGSLMKSSGALGGSVALKNNTSLDNRSQVMLEQSFGSFQSVATNASVLFNGKKFASDTRFAYQASENDFEYLNTAVIPGEEMTQTNAAFRNTGFTQQFIYAPSERHQISFNSWNQWHKRDIPPIMPNVHKGGDPKEYQNGFFSRNILGWNYAKNQQKIEVKAAYLFEDQNYYLKTTTNADSADIVTLIDSENHTQSLAIKAKYETVFKKGFALTVGLDIDFESVNSNNYADKKDRNTYGIYANLLKSIRDRLKFNFLIRSEIADADVLPVMPLFGMNYKLMKKENLFVRVSISRNYHLPSLNDLYWYPGGNEALQPEEGLETEGGINFVKTFNEHFSLNSDLGIYAARIDNWIQWVPSDFRYWSPENIVKVFARGIEFSTHLSGSLKKFDYKIFAEYAYTKTTNESEQAIENGTSGAQLVYIPMHSANGFMYGSYRGYYVSWNVNYIGERLTNKKPLPAYVLNNVSVGKKWLGRRMDVAARFKVNNLLNVEYQAIQWRAMPGRNFEINIQLKLKK